MYTYLFLTLFQQRPTVRPHDASPTSVLRLSHTVPPPKYWLFFYEADEILDSCLKTIFRVCLHSGKLFLVVSAVCHLWCWLIMSSFNLPTSSSLHSWHVFFCSHFSINIYISRCVLGGFERVLGSFEFPHLQPTVMEIQFGNRHSQILTRLTDKSMSDSPLL